MSLLERDSLVIAIGLSMLLAIVASPSKALADPCKAIPDKGPLPQYLKAHSEFEGRVTYVGDGDSLCIAVGPSAAEWVEVRLEDFYAPELNALGGREAKEALESVTKGKRLSCLASHRSYDRIVATCKIGTASVGDLMRRRVLEGGNGHSASR